MIAIIPEPVIGMPRNTDRHRPESPNEVTENKRVVKKAHYNPPLRQIFLNLPPDPTLPFSAGATA
jgi:hypothetical protein